MWAGTKWEALSEFLRENEFDILNFQEVAGAQTHCGNVHCEVDCFERLQHLLGPKYVGQLTKTMTFTSNPLTSYEGNAIFYKNDFTLLKKHILTLFKGPEPFPSEKKTYEDETRDALHLTLERDAKTLDIISTHLAWAATNHEQLHQREQNKKLIEYVSHLPRPFVITGDFNISPNEQSILDLEKYGRNLTKEFGIKNTIDSINHVSWEKIKPGFPIDYIFVSPGVRVNNFEALIHVHMSDHVGLRAEIEV